VLSLLLATQAALTDVPVYYVKGGRQDLRFASATRDFKTVEDLAPFAERDTVSINKSRMIGRTAVTDNGVLSPQHQ